MKTFFTSFIPPLFSRYGGVASRRPQPILFFHLVVAPGSFNTSRQFSSFSFLETLIGKWPASLLSFSGRGSFLLGKHGYGWDGRMEWFGFLFHLWRVLSSRGKTPPTLLMGWLAPTQSDWLICTQQTLLRFFWAPLADRIRALEKEARLLCLIA